MASYLGYSKMLDSPDLLINKIERNLCAIDAELSYYIEFNNRIQINNLLQFIKESNERIQQYEHIYPYIKEMCTDQRINPIWYHKIEDVLKWALEKGRGDRHVLSEEIKDAWLTYIVVLSCSMIDKESNYYSNAAGYSSEDYLQRLKENN